MKSCYFQLCDHKQKRMWPPLVIGVNVKINKLVKFNRNSKFSQIAHFDKKCNLHVVP